MHASGRTVVALLGDKAVPLAALVESVQARFAGVGVRPRPVADVHATIVGLETGGVDVAGLCGELARTLDAAPLAVRFGFPDRDLALSSRGRRLHERTLTVTADKVVLIGWPVDPAGRPTARLDELRRDLARFGARHRYGADPDCYLVLGDVPADAGREPLLRHAAAVRAELARAPCSVRVAAADVRLAAYTDPRLPAATTRTVPVSVAATGVMPS